MDDSEWVMSICNLYFVLEGELLALKDKGADANTKDEECKLLLRSIRQFKNMVVEQCTSLDKLYSLSDVRRLLSIPMKLFSELYFDQIAFSPDSDEPLERGSGPISFLYAETQSIVSLNSYQQKEGKIYKIKEKLKNNNLLSPHPLIQQHNLSQQQEEEGEEKPPPLPPKPRPRDQPMKQSVQRKDFRSLIAMENVTEDQWISAIKCSGDVKEKTLKFDYVTVNSAGVKSLLAAIESGKMDISKVIFDSCMIGPDGVKSIVAYCKKESFPCTVLLDQCMVGSASEKDLSEEIPRLSVGGINYVLLC